MSSRSSDDVEGEPVAKKSRLVHKTIIYDESIANQWLDEPPLEVWDHHIIPLLSLKDLALSRTVCTFFEAYWQEKFSNNVLPLRVGNDVATINDVMGVIEILSSRREYTQSNPFVVILGKGDHPIYSSWTDPIIGGVHYTTLGITRSNITFVGEGKDTTTILGGFAVVEQENIMFKQMTVTNTMPGCSGIELRGAVEIKLIDVAVVNCCEHGLYVLGTSRLVATRSEMSNNGGSGLRLFNDITNAPDIPTCILGDFNTWSATSGPAIVHLKDVIMHHNSNVGVNVYGNSTVNIHGNATAIHSTNIGLLAYYSAKVLIHLPSDHNTSFNNEGGDRIWSTSNLSTQHNRGYITNVEVED